MKNDSLFQFDDILGQYKSTSFSPTHVTTHYNPTTTHQTGIFRLLLCKVLISYVTFMNMMLFLQYNDNYPTVPTNS